jgi:hypothetical protein
VKPEKTIYYVITGVGDSPTEPTGLARRTFTEDGRLDEALRENLTWERDTAIIEWESGNLVGELTEISEAEAQALIERFQEKWATQRGSDN